MIQTSFIKLFLLITLFVIPRGFFSSYFDNSTLSENDVKEIRSVLEDYRTGWLENDSIRILNLFTDSAIIIPSGLEPKSGRKEMKDFWFPDDNSTTIIHSFDIKVLNIHGNDCLAYTYETLQFSFSYEKDDFSMNKDVKSYAITIYQKIGKRNWKIVKRIWSDL